MDRRVFITIVGGSIPVVSLAAEAQEIGKVWRIGFLSPYGPDYDATWRAGFRLGLRDLGYFVGKNIVIEERHVRGIPGKRLALLKELVPKLSRVAVLVTQPPLAATLKALEAPARTLGMTVVRFDARGPGNLEGVSPQ